MKKLAFFIVVFLSFFFLSTKNANAVTVSVTSSPSTITNEEFEVGVNISGAGNGTNYVRVDLYKEGSSNYFGETYNGNSWYSGSSGNSYAPLTIASSSASITVKARLGSPNSTDYPGSGNYKLKIRRYTSSGSAASSDTQTPVDIQINYTFATTAPTAAPTSVPTSSPTVKPTSTPTIKPLATKTPTPRPSASVHPEETPDSSPQVLGDSSLNLSTATPFAEPVVKENKAINFPWIAALLITLGVVCIGIPIITFFRRKSLYNNSTNEQDS